MNGYNKPLFILAFDHRSSLLRKVFGVEQEHLDLEKKTKIIEAKKVIYEGFKRAVAAGFPKENAAILVDEEFGDEIIRDAKKEGFMVALSTEKSGQKEFDLEYGQDFASHIAKYQPDFVKALVRYDPDKDGTQQLDKLKVLNDYCRQNDRRFLIELLIESSSENNQSKAKLIIQSIQQFQRFGVEPDIWKIEGMDNVTDYKNAVMQARTGGRDQVGVIILGRGESREQVEKWLIAGKNVEGVIGFAIGRTIYLQPIMDFIKRKITSDQAAEEISQNYRYFYQIFNF